MTIIWVGNMKESRIFSRRIWSSTWWKYIAWDYQSINKNKICGCSGTAFVINYMISQWYTIIFKLFEYLFLFLCIELCI